MSIIFLIGRNDDPGHLGRSLAICDELSRAGEPPVLFSEAALPLSVLRRYPCKWVLPFPQASAAEASRVVSELVNYAALSDPPIVFEDTYPSGLSLPRSMLRLLVVAPGDFSHLTWLQRHQGETYDRFLLAGSPGRSTWPYDSVQTDEILSWPRWSLISLMGQTAPKIAASRPAQSRSRRARNHNATVAEIIREVKASAAPISLCPRSIPRVTQAAKVSACLIGADAPRARDIESGGLSRARESLSGLRTAKLLAIRVDQVIELDERMDWLLRLLARLRLCAALEVVPYLCRIAEPDLLKYDDSAALFEVSQHGYAQLPMTFGNDRTGEFSCESDEPTYLEIDNLREGFEKLSRLFPHRFNRGLSPPFDSIPDWLPQVWKDLNGRFISSITSRPRGSTLPVVRLYTDFWNGSTDRPRPAKAVLSETFSQFVRHGYAGLIIRPQQLSDLPARQSLERILETLVKAGAISCPLSALAIRQGHAAESGAASTGRPAELAIDATACKARKEGEEPGPAHLKEKLDLLAMGRDRTRQRLVFDFKLRGDNLDEALDFLDLCEEYRAMPRYQLDFGGEGLFPSFARDSAEVVQLYATLERLDKEMWSRGFSNDLLADSFSYLSRVSPSRSLRKLLWPQLIYGDSTGEGALQVARGIARAESSGRPAVVLLSDRATRNDDRWASRIGEAETAYSAGPRSTDDSEISLSVAEGAGVETILRRCSAIIDTSKARGREDNCLVIRATSGLKRHLGPVLERLKAAQIGRYLIQIPYFDGGERTSALEWRGFVTRVKDAANEMGWEFLGGRPDPCALGLDIRNQYPEATVRYARQSRNNIELSIVSSIHNRRSQLPAFLESINRQGAAGSFEIVLVDDGSSDGSLDVARKLCSQLEPRIDVLLISLERPLPYRQETFTFRAGAARQRGVELARGEQILFLDPDQEARADCVAQHRWWNKRGFDVVIGDRAYASNGAYDPESIYRARMRRRALYDCRDWWLAFYTGNSSVSRAALDAAGGFDESLQYWGLDDTDLGYRLALAGATFWYTLRACVTHVDKVESGGGSSREARERSCWLLMEVLFRKYLDVEILDAYRYLWAEGRSWGDLFQRDNKANWKK